MGVEAVGFIKTHYSISPKRVACGTKRGSTGRFAQTRDVKQVTYTKCRRLLRKIKT